MNSDIVMWKVMATLLVLSLIISPIKFYFEDIDRITYGLNEEQRAKEKRKLVNFCLNMAAVFALGGLTFLAWLWS